MTDIEPSLGDQHGMRAPGTLWMIAGSLVGAVAAYVFHAVAGRALGTVAFAPIGVLWTSLFIIATVVLVPLEQYATREASRDRHVLTADFKVWGALVAVATLIGVGFVLATDQRFFGGEPVYVLQMGLMLAGYGVLFVGRGILAGQRRFKEVGALLAAESLFRLVLALVVVRAGGDAVAVGWTMVLAPLAVILVPFWRPPADRSLAPSDQAGRFLTAYASGSAASQILLAASPLAVSFLGGSNSLFSVVFQTFTIFRAPLTLIFSLQGRLLSMLVRLFDARQRARLRTISALFAGGGFLLTFAAWEVGRLAGPGVMRLLFGEEFVPSVAVAGLVAAGMVAASTAQITGQVLVAEGRTGRLAAAWTSALVVAGVALVTTTEGTPDLVVARSFALGELAALCVVGFTVIRMHRAPRPV